MRGQAMVEFSLAITIFLVILMGTIDLGRAAYQYNGVAQAARELARVASVHPGTTLGIERRVQRHPRHPAGPRAGPGDAASTPASTSPVRPSAARARGGNWVRVTITSTFTPVTPPRRAARRTHAHQLGQRQDRMTTRSRSVRNVNRELQPHDTTRSDGQVLVVFALSLITLLGFAGLAVDGGSTFAQRRSQQTAADMAALAAANDYLVNGSATLATTRSQTVTAGNGFTNGTGGTTVATTLDTTQRRRGPGHDHRGPPERDGEPARLSRCGWSRRPRPRSPDSRTRRTARRRSSSRRRHSRATARPLYQTPTDFGEGNGDVPNEPARHRVDQLRDRQREHDRRRRDHPGRHDDQQDARLRRVHRPAQQRQPHGPVRRRRHVPERARRPGRDRRREHSRRSASMVESLLDDVPGSGRSAARRC